MILVVEDGPDDALVVESTFRDTGFCNPIHFVEDGQEAIDYLVGAGDYADRERWPLPILVILDINLPKRDGFEVLWATEQVRVKHGIVFVVLSVSDSAEDNRHARHLGASRVVRKPIDPVRLLEVVSEVHEFALMLVKRPI